MLSSAPNPRSNSSSLVIFLAFPRSEVCFVMVRPNFFFQQNLILPHLILAIDCTNTIFKVIM